MSIRERIKEIQKQLRENVITPQLARESQITLSALYGSVCEALTDADVKYKRVIADAFEAEGKANRAKMRAERSMEYADLQMLKATEKTVLEMIRSCRAAMRSMEKEYEASR